MGAFPRKGSQVCASLILSEVPLCMFVEGKVGWILWHGCSCCPVGCKPCSTVLPVRQEGAFIARTRRFHMYGAGVKPRKSQIRFTCWRLLAVNCSANCQAGFECCVLSCAKNVSTKGMTAFHWGPVGKLFRDLRWHIEVLWYYSYRSSGGPSKKGWRFPYRLLIKTSLKSCFFTKKSHHHCLFLQVKTGVMT